MSEYNDLSYTAEPDTSTYTDPEQNVVYPSYSSIEVDSDGNTVDVIESEPIIDPCPVDASHVVESRTDIDTVILDSDTEEEPMIDVEISEPIEDEEVIDVHPEIMESPEVFEPEYDMVTSASADTGTADGIIAAISDLSDEEREKLGQKLVTLEDLKAVWDSQSQSQVIPAPWVGTVTCNLLRRMGHLVIWRVNIKAPNLKTNTPIGTLPEGFRPSELIDDTFCNLTVGGTHLRIETDGSITAINTYSTDANTWLEDDVVFFI